LPSDVRRRTPEDGKNDLLTLASILGHSNLNQGQRYAHPSEARKKDAVNKNKAKAVQNEIIRFIFGYISFENLYKVSKLLSINILTLS